MSKRKPVIEVAGKTETATGKPAVDGPGVELTDVNVETPPEVEAVIEETAPDKRTEQQKIIDDQKAASDKRVKKAQLVPHIHHGVGTVLQNPDTGQTLETDWQSEIKSLLANGWKVIEVHPQKKPEPGAPVV